MASERKRELGALIAGGGDRFTEAARVRIQTALIDHDYLAYWVDELELRVAWRELGQLLDGA